MYFIQIIWKDNTSSYFQFNTSKDLREFMSNEDFSNIISYNLFETKKITYKKLM